MEFLIKKVDFFSTEYCDDNLRMLGRYFSLEEEAEAVIEKYHGEVKEELKWYKEQLSGKKVYIFFRRAKKLAFIYSFRKRARFGYYCCCITI
ncbi:hypothetical protein [Methanobrevibacter arboriphilus]|uniref:hypothetical protein n=1 Tax=Methanobrevibacter arboriphilus TaxID=39441 RepID=UPI001CDAB5A3|nr:hypothetical protein [Methanobrevibacter arboriphilus]